MASKVVKIVTALCIIIAMLILLSSQSYAAEIPKPSGPYGENIKNAGSQILNIILAIGAAVATVILVWLGIKYVVGAPDEKANIKKSAVIFIIGAVIIFGAVGLMKFIAEITGSTGNALDGGGGAGTGGAGVYTQDEVDAMEGKTPGIPQGN